MAELDSTDLHIGDTPQYFFDNGMVEEIQNVSRTIHRPEMCDENPLIEQDRPWEHALNMHADDYQVWRDDALKHLPAGTRQRPGAGEDPNTARRG